MYVTYHCHCRLYCVLCTLHIIPQTHITLHYLSMIAYLQSSQPTDSCSRPSTGAVVHRPINRFQQIVSSLPGVQWRSYRGCRRFNEPGPPSSWGPPSQATKKLNKKIIGLLLKKLTINRYTRDSCVHLNGQYRPA